MTKKTNLVPGYPRVYKYDTLEVLGYPRPQSIYTRYPSMTKKKKRVPGYPRVYIYPVPEYDQENKFGTRVPQSIYTRYPSMTKKQFWYPGTPEYIYPISKFDLNSQVWYPGTPKGTPDTRICPKQPGLAPGCPRVYY